MKVLEDLKKAANHIIAIKKSFSPTASQCSSDSEEQFQALQQKVEPFKEQLESFELEKNALLSRTEASKEEVGSFWLFSVISSNLSFR